MKFTGTFLQLKDKVLLTGIDGEWVDLGIHKQYRAENGAILNWWESSKNIAFQGDKEAGEQLKTALNQVLTGQKNIDATKIQIQLDEIYNEIKDLKKKTEALKQGYQDLNERVEALEGGQNDLNERTAELIRFG